jgi:hypothetical protein
MNDFLQVPALRSTAGTSTAPTRRRRTCRAYAAGLALALCTVAENARAQFDVVLRDADTPGFVDVLRADIARNTATRRAGATIAREIQAGIDATLATSHEDPLAYVRARTAHLVLPPDARYDERCSRALSRANYRPFAVYAVGRPATDVAARHQGSDPRSLSGKEVHALLAQQANSSAGRAFDATIRFYRARGFETVGTVASTATLHWKGPDRDPLAAVVYLDNAGAGVDASSCGHLGNTALLSLTIREPQAWAKTSGATSVAKTSLADADAAFASALARAGMTQDRYAALVNAAWQALREMQDPQQAQETEGMARIPALRAQAEARRQNRAWMERHRVELGPLLEAYGRSL